MRAVAFYVLAAACILAGLLLLLAYVMLEVDEWRRQHHKPVSEYRKPPAGPAPGSVKR